MLNNQLNITSFQWDPSSENETNLKRADIHIWCLPFNVSQSLYQRLQPFLSHDEYSRVKRYHFEKDRDRFVVRRAFLKIILSHYTGILPEYITFTYNRHGKPKLDQKKKTITFNASFSNSYAIYVFAKDRNIGIDIEKIRNLTEIESIVDHFFTFQERAYFLSHKDRHKAFFTLWTRKEAYLKAQGVGLSSQDNAQVDLKLWRFWRFTPTPGYIACLASIQQDTNILCFDQEKFCKLLL